MDDIRKKLDGVVLKVKQLTKQLTDAAQKKLCLLEEIKAITLLEEQWQEALSLQFENEKILRNGMKLKTNLAQRKFLKSLPLHLINEYVSCTGSSMKTCYDEYGQQNDAYDAEHIAKPISDKSIIFETVPLMTCNVKQLTEDVDYAVHPTLEDLSETDLEDENLKTEQFQEEYLASNAEACELNKEEDELVTETFSSGSVDKQVGGKKRRRREGQWKRNISKQRRNSGLEYINSMGETVPAKKLKSPGCNSCLFQCWKISEEQRQLFFDEYYSLPDLKTKKRYLADHIVETDVQRRRPRTAEEQLRQSEPRRKSSRQYYLASEEISLRRVCLKFFCSTFAISTNVIKTLKVKADVDVEKTDWSAYDKARFMTHRLIEDRLRRARNRAAKVLDDRRR